MTKLANICTNEGKKAEKDVLLSIIDRADGSLRDAENILDALLTINDRLLARNLDQLYGSAPKHALSLLDCCVRKDLAKALLTVPQIWESGVALSEVAQLVVTYAGDLIRLDSGQTIYRPSFIVSGLQDILQHVVIDISTLSSIMLAFTGMVQKGREDQIYLDITICDAILGTKEESYADESHLVTVDANNDW